MKYLITGVAGFVGSSLADQLLEAGHEVIGIDCFIDYYPRQIKERNLLKAKSYNNFTFIEADILQIDLKKILAGVDVVYHQAAQAGVRASWGQSFSIYTDNNIFATQRLLEAAKDHLSSLKKVVYASSSSVYGHAETLPTRESILPKPVSPYGVSKLAAEHLMVLYTSEFAIPTASLRYFTVYGPRQRPDMAFNRFIKAGLLGEEIAVYGDGEQSRDFTFISDILAANIAAAENTTEQLVFNIGGGSRVTVNQVLSLIEDIIGRKLKVKYHPRAIGDARHTGADTTLARQELNYQPKVSLKEGLAKEAAWLQETLT
jgi:nucleoside-diphosphate-sugar epimerase